MHTQTYTHTHTHTHTYMHTHICTHTHTHTYMCTQHIHACTHPCPQAHTGISWPLIVLCPWPFIYYMFYSHFVLYKTKKLFGWLTESRKRICQNRMTGLYLEYKEYVQWWHCNHFLLTEFCLFGVVMVPKYVDMYNNSSVELKICTSQRDRCNHENKAILVWHEM